MENYFIRNCSFNKIITKELNPAVELRISTTFEA